MSSSLDVEQAARETLREALRGADRDGLSPAFAIVLSTDGYDADALAAAFTRALGGVPWAGCCAAGVFAGTEVLEQGVVLGLIEARDVSFGVGVGGPVSGNARAAGRAAVAGALDALGALPARTRQHRTYMILPDALTGNAADVIRGAVQEAGAGSVWAGGGAGDNLRFVRTAQFAFGRAWRDRVVVVAIDGPVPISVGIRHGWHPYGPATMVTRAHGATAVELEYQAAFEVYRRTAVNNGDHVDENGFALFAMTHPLGIPQANGQYVIRDPLSVEPDGSLRCVAEVPDGSMVRVMQGDRADLLGAAEQAAREARSGVAGSASGAIVFDCVSRYLMLGPSVRDELAAIQSGIGRGTPMMGCLTLGELGALGTAAPQYHNKTAVVMALPRGGGWASPST